MHWNITNAWGISLSKHHHVGYFFEYFHLTSSRSSRASCGGCTTSSSSSEGLQWIFPPSSSLRKYPIGAFPSARHRTTAIKSFWDWRGNNWYSVRQQSHIQQEMEGTIPFKTLITSRDHLCSHIKSRRQDPRRRHFPLILKFRDALWMRTFRVNILLRSASISGSLQIDYSAFKSTNISRGGFIRFRRQISAGRTRIAVVV